MAPKPNSSWNLGHLPNLYRHYLPLRLDNDTHELSPTKGEKHQADLAQDGLVIPHCHRARDSGIDCMVCLLFVCAPV